MLENITVPLVGFYLADVSNWAIGSIFLCILAIFLRSLLNPLRKLPGPWYTTFSGVILLRYTLAGKRLHYIHRLHQVYGPIVRIGPHEVDISSVDGFQKIHKIGGGFLKAPWYQRFRSGGVSVFNAIDPKVHGRRRKFLARPFSKSSLRQNWEPYVASKSRKTVAKIRDEAEGGVVDVMKWWTLMTTDVIGKLSFGEPFEMVELGKKNEFVLDMESVSKSRGIRAELTGLYDMIKFVSFGLFDRLEEIDKRIQSYSSKVVINAKSRSLERANIFSGVLQQGEENENQISSSDVVYEAAALVVAGSGTTAVTLTYLIWAVLSHPDIQKRLEKEVAALGEKFTDADLEALPFLSAVIEETLRLYGAAPGSLPRTTPDGGLLVGGYYIQPGTIVNTQAYTLHRDQDAFEFPEKFYPERFLTTSQKEKPTFSPFGAGSRICLGLHLAYMEMRYATANFFRECPDAKLATSTTSASMEIEHFFLISPKHKRCEITI